MHMPARAPGRGPHPLSLFLALAMRRTEGDPVAMARVLKGLRLYQEAPQRRPMPEAPVVARRGAVSIRRIGGPADGPAVLVVPSLINAAFVLDLAPGRSLVRYLAEAGFQPMMVDWGPLGPGERRLGLAGLVTARLLPLARALGVPLHILGYCVGGTLALALARLFDNARSLALIAAPWHFDGFPRDARTGADAMWRSLEPLARQLGGLPISLLNPLFWSLDEDAVVRKFASLADLSSDDPKLGWFASVEDWANSGAPLAIPAARDLFQRGYRDNAIGEGRWQVAATPIRPGDIACPIADFGATRDRIVPPAARLRLPGIDRFDAEGGHVGMVVGSAARQSLWDPLSNWLASR